MALGEPLPRAASGTAVQVLGVDDDGTVISAILGTETSSALPSGADIVEVNLTSDAYIAFGDSGVTASASSRVLPAGSYYYRLLEGQTHVSYLDGPSGAGGTITIAEAK